MLWTPKIQITNRLWHVHQHIFLQLNSVFRGSLRDTMLCSVSMVSSFVHTWLLLRHKTISQLVIFPWSCHLLCTKDWEANLAATREGSMVATVGWWLLWTATAHVPITPGCISFRFIQKHHEGILQVPSFSSSIISVSSTILEGMAKIVCFSEKLWVELYRFTFGSTA